MNEYSVPNNVKTSYCAIQECTFKSVLSMSKYNQPVCMYFITYICDPYYLIVHSCNVRVIKSDRAGVGKSLRVQRLTEALTTLNGALYTNTSACVTVTLQQKSADHSDVLRTLVKHIEQQPDRIIPRVFHFDIAREVT